MPTWAQARHGTGLLTTEPTLAPEWLAHRYDETTDQIRFVDYDRATRASVPFLIDQYLPAKPFKALDRQQARQAAPATAPVHFIFHSGFCCSTLLADCFDQPGLATPFSEPMILNDLVGWRKRGAAPAAVGTALDDALAMLARPFEGDLVSIVKPSTIVNGLASAMMRLRPESKAIFIHAPVADFITSIAKKGLDGRLWARELFLGMRREGLTQRLGFDDPDFFGQTDLQIAACAWLGQQVLFADIANLYPDRLQSVSSDQFLAAPEQAIRAAADLFGLAISDEQTDAALAGPMQRNSKDRTRFSAADRTADYDRARAAYGDEIDKVAVWAVEVAKSAGVPLTPAKPLMSEA
jgi:hypothetical protein